MTNHCELLFAGFDVVGNEGCEHNLSVDARGLVGSEADSNQSVWECSKIFTVIPHPALCVIDVHETAVDIERALVVGHRRFIITDNVQCSDRLVIGTLSSLQIMLQRIGQTIVLVEECLPYFGHPLRRSEAFPVVDGASCPVGNVVEMDDVVGRIAIDESANLSVSYGQTLLEVSRRFIIP